MTVGLVALAVVAAGCGGGSAPKHSAAPGCAKTRTSRGLERVRRDIAAIRRAALTVPPGHTFNGNAAVGAATDRFLLDLFKAPISNLQRNRLIDHAMSALLSQCQQCFEALEAQRPIVTIRFRDSACAA